MKRRSYYQICAVACFWAAMTLLVSCHKSAFLDKNPNTTLVVPTTLMDFQALLDNDAVMGVTPVLGEVSADNFYLVYNFWQSLDVREHNAYIWAPDIYGGQGLVDDWDVPYQQVFYSNVILEGLPNVKVDGTNLVQWNTIKGSALFTRAYAFYNLAQLFAPVFDDLSTGNDSGIPLRLTADINAPTVRSSVHQTYDTILSNLWQAVNLLPTNVPGANLNRPSRPAAQALLARVYLSMRKYDSAGAYANLCLQSHSALIDYDTLIAASRIPISLQNDETLYESTFLLANSNIFLGNFYSSCVIDSTLYQSYAANDLRRIIFYRTGTFGPFLKGSYNGSGFPFSGLATDEMYLVRAECAARASQTTAAMNDLNTLWKHRCDSVTYVPLIANSAEEALDIILLERRKELAFRGLRWTDLRRLNKETGRQVILKRNLNGMAYTLAPNSDLYTLPIPPDVIGFSKIPQNPR